MIRMGRRRPYSGLSYKHDLLESLVTILPSYSVAEIGVGTGHSCFTLAKKTASMTGIDIDAELIAVLEEYAAGYDNLRLLCADATAHSPPEECRGQMDIVFSIDTFQFTAPPERFLAYIEKLLKPEGRAVVCFPNEPDEEMEGTVNFTQIESLLDTIDAGGLHSESIRVVRHTRRFKFITKNFWYNVKKIYYRKYYEENTFPHVFSDTVAYKLLKEKRGVPWPIRAYTAFIMTLLRAGEVCSVFDSRRIYGEYLILTLSKKKRAG